MTKLPDSILDHRNAFVGTAGAGKTYAAKSGVEILLARQWRVCIVDPLGVWWGLRSDADGTGEGFDITIFGGAHGDLPLTEAAAPIIAEAVAGGNFSCILDLSALPSQAARRRFMKAFAEAIYAKNSEPLHLVLDEADLFCPQRPIEDIAQILGARIDEIVRRGRVKGFVPWLISQRPAVIHKDVLSQVDTLIAFKLTSSQDRDALGAWIEGQADRAEQKRIYAKLPTLRQGDCIVWSPADGILQDYRFPKARTFDSSRTPKRGERVAAPTAWSKPDLESLRAKMATVEQDAAANDPKALKARIAELERQAGKQGVDPAEMQLARQAAWAEGRATGHRDGRHEAMTSITSHIDEALEALREDLKAGIDKIMTMPLPTMPGAAPPVERRPLPPAASVAHQSPVQVKRSAPSCPGEKMPVGERAILIAVAQHGSCTREQLSVLTGYKRSSRDAYIQRLSGRGLVEVAGNAIVATDAGIKALGSDYEPLPHGRALQRYWLDRLPEGERAVLQVILDVYPKTVSRDQIDAATNYKRSSRDAYIQRLRTRQLVTITGRGEVRASENLF